MYDKDAANANARLVGAVAVHPGLLPVCALSEGDDARQDRQLHVPQGLRDMAEPVDHQLRDSGRYCDAIDQGSKPLREARIDVTEVPGKPGAYRAVAFLRPHFQLDELSDFAAAGCGTAAVRARIAYRLNPFCSNTR